MSYRFEDSYTPLNETSLDQLIQEEVFNRKLVVWLIISLAILASLMITSVFAGYTPNLVTTLAYTAVSTVVGGLLTHIIAAIFFNAATLRKVALRRLLGEGAEYVH